MSVNCQNGTQFTGSSIQYRRILLIVIAINATMFIVEMSYGISGESQALKADALDFLGDSMTYALSLWAIAQPASARSNVALFKGISLLCIAVWVLGSTIYHVVVVNNPVASIMVSVALAALAANIVSVLLLIKYRDGDANIRSVWLCSRNDAIGNIGVLFGAGLVYLLNTRWPDLIVALILSTLFIHSAINIIKQARAEKLLIQN